MENKNLLTVDVEDWVSSSLFLLSPGEAANARQYLAETDPQVEKGVGEVLELLAERNFKATFFVLGQTAKSHKALIRRIHDNGHEIASHSLSHALLPGLPAHELIKELKESKDILEDISGAEVSGFRAPNLTGYPDIPFFFRQLAEIGYAYDSSFKRDAYYLDSELKNSEVEEIPVTVVKYLLCMFPLGGMYLKTMEPFMVSRYISKENRENRPSVIYVHPYELAGTAIHWRHPSPSLRARYSLLLRNTRKGHHTRVLTYLFNHHRFTSIKEYLAQNTIGRL